MRCRGAGVLGSALEVTIAIFSEGKGYCDQLKLEGKSGVDSTAFNAEDNSNLQFEIQVWFCPVQMGGQRMEVALYAKLHEGDANRYELADKTICSYKFEFLKPRASLAIARELANAHAILSIRISFTSSPSWAEQPVRFRRGNQVVGNVEFVRVCRTTAVHHGPIASKPMNGHGIWNAFRHAQVVMVCAI